MWKSFWGLCSPTEDGAIFSHNSARTVEYTAGKAQGSAVPVLSSPPVEPSSAQGKNLSLKEALYFGDYALLST